MPNMVVTASKGGTVNMRSRASTSSEVLCSVPIKSTVEVLAKENDEWFKIKYKDKEGYMMAKYLVKQDLLALYNSLKECLTLIEKLLK